MFRHLFTVLLLVSGGAPATKAQSDSAAVPASHFYKHTLFVCPDTTYKITYVLSGVFGGRGFYREWLDTANFGWRGMAQVSMDDTPSDPLILRAELLPGVDTLRSLFSSSIYKPEVSITVQHKGYSEHFSEDELTEDAFLAYALREFGLVSVDTATAYYFGPADPNRPRGVERYVLCQVEGWRGTDPTFKYILGRIVPAGLEIIERDTLSVPPKEMERLRRKLNTFVGGKWESCVCSEQGTAELLMIGDNRIVIAEHCRDGKRLRHRPDAVTGTGWIYWAYTRPPTNFFGFPKKK